MTFLNAVFAGFQPGLLIGFIFGPLRLAGVDYSAWFRDPAEVAERQDRSWIGLAKLVTLRSAYLFLLCPLIYVLSTMQYTSMFDPFLNVVRALFDLSPRAVSRFIISHLSVLFGLLIGIALVQAALERLWRIGLVRGSGKAHEIRLSRSIGGQDAATNRGAPVAGRRRLIICCDGTWNFPNQERETNVVQLLRAIKPVATDGLTQISYYHLGVGTGNLIDRFFGGGAGIGLSSSVKACYGFLVDNYNEGDEILLFGFSRGAYVVRSVAGMVGRVGLLRRHEMVRFNDVWNYYALPERQRMPEQLDEIAPGRSRGVEISCVGVWDTVGALGIPGSSVCARSYGFHQTALGAHVRHAFQALAIDERRGNFQPAIWVRTRRDQILEQVWFPGVHSNVGGGYLQHGLSDATLLWILSKLDRYHLLEVDISVITEAIRRHHAEMPPLGRLQNSRKWPWWLIASPVPRPVGITDDSEQIHVSSIDRRGAAGSGDIYSAPARVAWLETIPAQRICSASQFEQMHAFPGPGPGSPIPLPLASQRGLCDRLLRWIFGQA